ncbi:MAG: CoA transferase [Dehalococcoidia bacterium]
MMSDHKPGALNGLLVLDFTWVYAGPFASRQLVDLGAEVIKVERYKLGAIERHYYLELERNGVRQSSYSTFLNRGKKSLCIDIKTEEGRNIILNLAKKADVLLENLSPGAMSELCLGYEDVKRVNPKIIYCSICCFGQYGPYSHEPGFDIIAQAASGWIGQADPNNQAPVAIGDCNAGIHSVAAILAALYYREKTDIGQYIDISMTDCLFHLHEANPPAYLFSNREISPKPIARWHSTYAPYGILKAPDGFIAIAAITEDIWKILVKLMGNEYEWLLTDPRTCRLEARLTAENAPFIHQLLEDWLAKFDSVHDAEHLLKEAGVPCMRVKTFTEIVDDPHIRAREMIVKMKQPFVGEVETYGSPFKMSATSAGVRGYAPLLGEHNRQILSSMLGYSDEQVNALYEDGVLYKESAVDKLPAELKRLSTLL